MRRTDDTTTRARIEAVLAAGPRTGAQVREQLGGTATAVHRYLCELRRRGHVVGVRRKGDPMLYALPGHQERHVVLAWRSAA